MRQHTRRPGSVNPSEPSGNSPSLDGQARGPADDGLPESFPFGANAEAAAEPSPRPAGEREPADKPVNPFSREALRLNQNYTAALGLERHIHNIPVDKPPTEAWFRVHPNTNDRGEEMFFDTYLLHVKNGPDRGVYQVSADLLPMLSGERLLKATRLVLCIDRQGELRLWPLRLPGPDGREDAWMSSALAVAEQAKQQWVRLVAGQSGYHSLTTTAAISDPIWPQLSLDEILELAFKKQRIASEADPVLRRLREGL
jgi:hypothetical protein